MVQVRVTDDGSHTLFHPGVNETYHSSFGAVGESGWVFIGAGYRYLPKTLEKISLLEVGMGTGLNVFLTLLEVIDHPVGISYDAIEPFPVEPAVALGLNYPETAGTPGVRDLFARIHTSPWEQPVRIVPGLTLRKFRGTLDDIPLDENHYDLCYFDAFSPNAQPELWTAGVFRKLASAMKKGGILTTYCCKGEVRRGFRDAGFTIEKLPGPPGKREILRATRS